MPSIRTLVPETIKTNINLHLGIGVVHIVVGQKKKKEEEEVTKFKLINALIGSGRSGAPAVLRCLVTLFLPLPPCCEKLSFDRNSDSEQCVGISAS